MNWEVKKEAETKILGAIRDDGKFVVRILFRNRVVFEIAEDSSLRNSQRDYRFSYGLNNGGGFGSRMEEVRYFLDQLQLPSTMTSAQYMDGFGTSLITPDGVIDNGKRRSRQRNPR